MRPLLVMGVLVLAACGAGRSGSPLPYVAEFALGDRSGEFVLTPASVEPLSFRASVAWVNEGRYLGVITFGSGSCPSGPHALDVVADQVVEIRLGPLFPDRDVCTADMSGHVTVVELPEGITPAKPLTARFGQREVSIPAAGR